MITKDTLHDNKKPTWKYPGPYINHDVSTEPYIECFEEYMHKRGCTEQRLKRGGTGTYESWLTEEFFMGFCYALDAMERKLL